MARAVLPLPLGVALGALLALGLFLLLYWPVGLEAWLAFALAYLVAAGIVWWLTRHERAAAIAPLLLLSVLVPFYLPAFEAANIVVFAIIAIGLNILTGQAGQVSLGHGALVAVGAYTTAILMRDHGWPFWATFPVAALNASLLGFLLGLPSLRLTGPYLAIATLALALVVPTLLKKFEPLTHGVQGILLRKPTPPAPLNDLVVAISGEPLAQDAYLYLLCLAVAAVMIVLAWNIGRGRTGRAFRALRDSEVAASVLGISIPVYKTLAFVVSAFFAGIGGALYAVLVGFVSPDSFSLVFSLQFLVMIVIGGLASIPGAILGALLVFELGLRVAPQVNNLIAPELTGKNPWMVYGVVLILMMIFAPTGVWGLIRRGWARVRRRTTAGPAQPQPASPEVVRSAGPG